MAAAAGAVQVILGPRRAGGARHPARVLGRRRPHRRRPAPACSATSAALLTAAEPLLQAGDDMLDGLLDRVEALPDADFLSRLPALRGGFQAVSPAARDRLLAVVEQRLGDTASARDIADVSPEELLVRLLADRAGARRSPRSG